MDSSEADYWREFWAGFRSAYINGHIIAYPIMLTIIAAHYNWPDRLVALCALVLVPLGCIWGTTRILAYNRREN